MKHIVMTTESPVPVNMDAAGIFETGKPRPVDNDELADLLLKREFPKFEESTAAAAAAAATVIEAPAAPVIEALADLSTNNPTSEVDEHE